MVRDRGKLTSMQYVTPLIGAIVADQYRGKYKTIFDFTHSPLSGPRHSLRNLAPLVYQGAALGGLIVAMFVVGLGTGGIKANVHP